MDPRQTWHDATAVEALVDRAFYVEQNASAVGPDEDAVVHFCRIGWRELRKPRRDFDVWWYWANHLDPADDSVNPLVHYEQHGRAAGLSTRPTLDAPAPGPALGEHVVRRAALFAAFDADGIVDDTVVQYVAELARHADVFVLYDCYVDPTELAKLDEHVAGAWAERHGAYDFGSYSRLARDLIGWGRLASYDEVVLANDSAYLVHDLDDVFSSMAQRPVAWWGLQATKGLHGTAAARSNSFTQRIPMDRVRHELLARYEDDAVYDFLVGSYFLALRQPVLNDPVFRRLLDSVTPQKTKLLVIQKYEIGLTHLLIGRGHSFDTFVPDLLPLHPVYGESAFTLIGEGFPLLKRFLITENHYTVAGLDRWVDRLRTAAPDARIDLIAASLNRLAPDDRIQRNAAIVRKGDGSVDVPRVLRGAAYRRRDEVTPKRDDVWVFAVDPRTHELPANSRAIFEAVKDEPSRTKVLLTRSRRLALSGTNVAVEPLLSPAGRDWLLEAGRIFVTSAPRATLEAPVDAETQFVVAVRDGLLWERIGRAARAGSTSFTDLDRYAHPEPDRSVSALLTASDVDALATVASTWPAIYTDGLRTGIPAHDFLFCPEEALPGDLRAQSAEVRDRLGGRRLLLLAPALPRPGRTPYVFSDAERQRLRAWCRANDVVLGLREARGDFARHYSRQLGDLTLDLSARRAPSLHAVLRNADALLTDYSGVALDLAITGRPVAAFVPDLATAADSLFYDVDHFFPGPAPRSFDELEAALDLLAAGVIAPRHQRIQEMLVDHTDASNTSRTLAALDLREQQTRAETARRRKAAERSTGRKVRA